MRWKYLILALCLIFYQSQFSFAEMPQWANTKKEITNLDWILLKAELDIRSIMSLLMDNFDTQKEWKIIPQLSLMGASSDKKKVVVSYNIYPEETYFSLEPLERRNQLEKIIEFTMTCVNRYFFQQPLNRKDFDMLLIVSKTTVGKLENGELIITEK